MSLTGAKRAPLNSGSNFQNYLAKLLFHSWISLISLKTDCRTLSCHLLSWKLKPLSVNLNVDMPVITDEVKHTPSKFAPTILCKITNYLIILAQKQHSIIVSKYCLTNVFCFTHDTLFPAIRSSLSRLHL